MVLQSREGKPLIIDGVRRRDEVATVHNTSQRCCELTSQRLRYRTKKPPFHPSSSPNNGSKSGTRAII
jgi:hypothetical protein